MKALCPISVVDVGLEISHTVPGFLPGYEE